MHAPFCLGIKAAAREFAIHFNTWDAAKLQATMFLSRKEQASEQEQYSTVATTRAGFNWHLVEEIPMFPCPRWS